jgi:hypothetical protein
MASTDLSPGLKGHFNSNLGGTLRGASFLTIGSRSPLSCTTIRA